MSSGAKTLKTAGILGLDFGSRFVKLAYTNDMRTFGKRKLDTLTFYRDFFRRYPDRVEFDWDRLRLKPPASLVATGYGKHLLQDYLPTITEIRAHFLGACGQTGLSDFILLEIGGQDTKVLYVKEGRVFDFLTNDRCAAGTGRYLENMSRFLRMPLKEFATYSQKPVSISNTCAIFGETELIGHLLDGIPLAHIAAGVNDSVARRALQMLRRYSCPSLVFVGGVARNQAVATCLRQRSDYEVIIPPDPQFNGALGCCLEAQAQGQNRELATEHRVAL
jgi:predicted CoA-substrate-specific enzyme activase